LATFARITGVEKLVTFHHDPAHTDDALDDLHERLEAISNGVDVMRGQTGLTFEV
jgi:hypothetical protein